MRCYFHLVNSHEEILDDEGLEVSDLEHPDAALAGNGRAALASARIAKLVTR